MLAVPNPNGYHYNPSPIYAIDDAIIPDTNPQMVNFCFELLDTGRKGIFTESGDLLGNAPLRLAVEISQLFYRRLGKFEAVSH